MRPFWPILAHFHRFSGEIATFPLIGDGFHLNSGKRPYVRLTYMYSNSDSHLRCAFSLAFGFQNGSRNIRGEDSAQKIGIRVHVIQIILIKRTYRYVFFKEDIYVRD